MDAAQKKGLIEAHKSGLTYEKVAADRMAAFEIGTEKLIEDAGMNEKTAEDFRGIMKQGLDELSADPEGVKQALKEAGVAVE